MIGIETIEKWNNLLQNIDYNDHNLLYEIAVIYEFGYKTKNGIVQINIGRAFEFYNKSYLLGNINSTIRVADFYSEGKICEKNIDLAIKLYKIGISNQNPNASHNLATVYRDLGCYKKAFEQYLETEKILNKPPIELAYHYYYGIGTKVNKQKALEIFMKIVKREKSNEYTEHEIEDSYYNIGLYYLEGIIVEKSITKARNYFKKANRDDDNRFVNELLLIIGK